MDAYRDQYATLLGDTSRVVLLAVSADPVEELAAWARDEGYPFRFLSDREGEMGKRYGVWEPVYRMDNRTLYVIGRDGRVAHVMAPFRELDPQAYRQLAAAVDSIAK